MSISNPISNSNTIIHCSVELDEIYDEPRLDKPSLTEKIKNVFNKINCEINALIRALEESHLEIPTLGDILTSISQKATNIYKRWKEEASPSSVSESETKLIYKTLHARVAHVQAPTPQASSSHFTPAENTITFLVEGQDFETDRSALLKKSLWARSMLKAMYAESSQSQITLENISISIFEHINTYLREERLPDFNAFSIEELIEIFECCNRLAIYDEFRTKCVEAISQKTSGLKIEVTDHDRLEVTITQDFFIRALSLQEPLFGTTFSLAVLQASSILAETSKLNLSELPQLNDSTLICLLDSFYNLETLILPPSINISQIGWEKVSDIRDLYLDLSNMPSVDDTAFASMVQDINESLSSRVHIHCLRAGRLSFEKLKALHEHLKEKIVTLELVGSTITGSNLIAIIEGCENLEALSLAHCKKIPPEYLSNLPQHLPLLKKFSLDRTAGVTDQTITAVAESCKHITDLNLAWQYALTSESFTALTENCRKIEVLNLTNCNKITNQDLQSIANHCSNLTEIYLNWCSQITESAVEDLRQRCTKLEKVSSEGISTKDSD